MRELKLVIKPWVGLVNALVPRWNNDHEDITSLTARD